MRHTTRSYTPLFSLLSICCAPIAVSAVTYYPIPGVSISGAPPISQSTVPPEFYSNLSAYNEIRLDPPGPPDGQTQRQFNIQLNPNPGGLSRPQPGNFLGFSIELSVADQLLGINSTYINVPLLNYLSNLRSRAGAGIKVRVGGNSQEDSTIHENDPAFDAQHKLIAKTANTNSKIPTRTPLLDYSDELLYMMSNISSLVSTHWYFGLAFAHLEKFENAVAAAVAAQRILGPNLLALQLSNEPDLYGVDDRRRTGPYLVDNLIGEWKTTIGQLEANPGFTQKQILLGPSVCCNSDGNWPTDDIMPKFVNSFPNELKVISVQHYPRANCVPGQTNAQDIFGQYLTHQSAQNMVSGYAATSALAQQLNKELVMFETNTASCGGFPGLSDSFGAALWAADYGLQMAFGNFTGALWHFGGQNVAYSPFTPPPGKTRKYNQWTTGPVYYATLAVTEALGSSNKSQVLDLGANNGNQFTPAYAIYENGQPTRVAIINYINDPSGGGDLTVKLQLPQGFNTGGVTVRYLLSAGKSVSDKGNFTWAGQTLGERFTCDGRLYGDVVTTPVPCDGTTLTCQVKVPGPSMALVFLTQASLQDSTLTPEESTSTFATTARSKVRNTATIAQQVLATSNGRGGPDSFDHGNLGTTSQQQSVNGAASARNVKMGVAGVGGVAVAVVAAFVGRMMVVGA